MGRVASVCVAVLAVALGGSTDPGNPLQEPGPLTVRDRTGAAVGRIDQDGTFRDRSGANLGRFHRGTVRDRSGSSIGRIDAEGRIRDRSGALMGNVDERGTLRDRSGSRVGQIDEDGTVRHRSGALSGRFQGYQPPHRHAVAAYLFFFNPLHRR